MIDYIFGGYNILIFLLEKNRNSVVICAENGQVALDIFTGSELGT